MKYFIVSTVLVLAGIANSQTINGYANVTAIAGAVLSVNNVDEGADSFEDGEWIVIMQMQDNVIGTTTNVAGFGSLGSIQNAGRYEIRQIQSHTESAGLPATITLTQSPNFTYNINANSSVQIITFRQYGSPNYTTTGNMSAKKWDGTTGGVLAFYVPGTLTLAHSLDANSDGFRGGGPNNDNGSAGCSGGSNYRVTAQNNFADKGESIFKRTTANQQAGMGRILNGGGGGNSHNGGGGGGGNYTAGGNGGPGYSGGAGGCSPSAGGLGGLSLSGSIDVSRIFMGGGGGAGEGNNVLSTDGGDGGGIILVKANQIITTACAGLTISADGEDISFAGNDGGGGGGAGGTIVFEVNSWSVSAGCPITVSANGGDGGDVNNGSVHGGGGGGGQGVIFYSTTAPANVTNQTMAGSGGCSSNAVPCTVPASDGAGPNNSGVQVSVTGPLPIELVEFDATLVGGKVVCSWITASELNNDFFTVERSTGDENWEVIGTRDGAGNSSGKLEYTFADIQPLQGYSYYRLKQTDFDGSYKYSGVEEVFNDGTGTLIYPNPAEGMVYIRKENLADYEIVLTNSLGQAVQITGHINGSTMSYDLQELPAGVYYILLVKDGFIESNRFILAN